MKLYYSKGTCALAVRITLHELNAPAEFEAVDLKTKKTQTGADFLAINPKGYVPVLQLDNGEYLTENIAIQIYLGDLYQNTELLPKVGDLNRYRVIEWLSYVSTELHKSCGPLFNPQVPDEMKEKIFKPILHTKLDFVNKRLEQQAYLALDHYTLADSYLYIVLRWLAHFNMAITDWPAIEKYFFKISERPSVVKSLAEGG